MSIVCLCVFRRLSMFVCCIPGHKGHTHLIWAGEWWEFLDSEPKHSWDETLWRNSAQFLLNQNPKHCHQYSILWQSKKQFYHVWLLCSANMISDRLSIVWSRWKEWGGCHQYWHISRDAFLLPLASLVNTWSLFSLPPSHQNLSIALLPLPPALLFFPSICLSLCPWAYQQDESQACPCQGLNV